MRAQVRRDLRRDVGGGVVLGLGAAGVRVLDHRPAAQVVVADSGGVALVVHHLGDLFQRIVGVGGPDGLDAGLVHFLHHGDQLARIAVGALDCPLR